MSASRSNPWMGIPKPVTHGRVALGRALMQARMTAGYTQRGLGRVVGLDQSVISRLENGRMIGLRLSTIVRLLDRMEVERIELHVRPGGPMDPWGGLFERQARPRVEHAADMHQSAATTFEEDEEADDQSPS